MKMIFRHVVSFSIFLFRVFRNFGGRNRKIHRCVKFPVDRKDADALSLKLEITDIKIITRIRLECRPESS